LAEAAEMGKPLSVADMFQGDPRWGRAKLSAEDERIIEGVLDENGIRTITLYKDSEKYDRRKLQNYTNLGYEIEEKSDRYLLRISQARFLENEAEIHDVNSRTAERITQRAGVDVQVSPDQIFSSRDLE
jgi:uncharacterized protein (DUF2267 family)